MTRPNYCNITAANPCGDMICLSGIGKCCYDIREISLQQIKTRLKEINDIMQPLYSEQTVLQNKMFDAKLKIMIETDVLSEEEWQTRESQEDLTLYSNTSNHKKLATLFESDYHCSTSFEAWNLRFSDGDIYISFKDIEKAITFIKKHNMKINVKDLTDDLERLNEQKTKLQLFLERIIS